MRLRSLLVLALLLTLAAPSQAYVEAPMSLGAIISQSVVVCSMVVTKVDKQNNLIIFQKVADIKGKHPQDTIKHNIGRGGLRPGEWQEIMNWAEVGKAAVFFHNGGASETYIGNTWYQAYPNGEWWGMSHGEPFLLRSYAGKVDKLPGVVADILAGKEVLVPCMVDGDKEAIHKKTAKIQRLKASLKIQDYDPKRDFAGWGGEDIRRLAGMPGFDRLAALGRADADAQAASAIDFDGDGKPDICLAGANRVLLLQNGGDAFSEVSLPGLVGGARSAVWADYNVDGMPDLLLATATGPRLYTNLGKGQFRDDTRVMPKELAYNLTAAAWGDFDADGRPDILLANGFHGLRLYRNISGDDPKPKFVAPKLGEWHAVGPFRHKDGPQQNVATAFGPEKDPFDANKVYKGKRDMEIKWTKGDYPDGQVNNLAPFGANCSTYLCRDLEAKEAGDIPLSLGNRDALTVWLNGEQVHADTAQRNAAADQVTLTLKLKQGKNRLVLKVTHGEGEGAFYFSVGGSNAPSKPQFADVSAAWGLGENGLAGSLKGDTLSVADFDGDGKPDVLFGAGTGQLLRNAGGRFELKMDSGINYKPGKVGPALCDFDGDGHVDLFVPQAAGCKLYRNDSTGKFLDATATSGDLAKCVGQAVGAAWGDFDNDGKPDLLVTLLRGPNRYYRNNGDGTFADRSAETGLSQKVFNSQAAAWADLNGDGRLDLILANEGQDSVALFGGPADASKWTPVVVQGLSAGKVTVTGADGKRVASSEVYSDGRGGQAGLVPRFALLPGEYKLAVRGTDGKTKEKAFTVATNPMNVKVE